MKLIARYFVQLEVGHRPRRMVFENVIENEETLKSPWKGSVKMEGKTRVR